LVIDQQFISEFEDSNHSSWPLSLKRMNVGAAIDPGPAPGRMVHKHGVRPPIEANSSRRPTPWREEPAESYAEAKSDPASNKESRAWSEKYNHRIIVRNHNITGIDGHDANVRPAAHYDLSVGSQIAVALRGGPLPLHGVHHGLPVGQETVPHSGGPIHVRIHHVQH